jgi:hypothetical protein
LNAKNEAVVRRVEYNPGKNPANSLRPVRNVILSICGRLILHLQEAARYFPVDWWWIGRVIENRVPLPTSLSQTIWPW